MIAEYDKEESNCQLGPLMPAGRVTIESFSIVADIFVQGCVSLMEEVGVQWQIKGEKQLEEFARKLEAQLLKETKKSLKSENIELKERTELLQA